MTHPRATWDRAATDAGGTELLVRVMVFALIAIFGIAVATATDAWWTTGLALASIALAVAGALVALAQVIGAHDERGVRASRRTAFALAGAAALALLLALVLPGRSAADRGAGSPATEATDTVRGYVRAAVVTDNPTAACSYLTPAEQRAVGRLAGPGGTCRTAFFASKPTFAGVATNDQLARLDFRPAVRGDRATVTVSGNGARPATFELRRATPAELNAYQAPQVPWRIDRGAAVVLTGAPRP